jgi:uncharacterized protein
LVHARFPLRVNVGFLYNVPIGTVRDIHFEFPVLKLPDDLEFQDFQGFVRLNRTPQGILVEGEFEGKTGVTCVRCLADFLQPLSTKFEELWAFSNRTVSEAGLTIPEDKNIDFGPVVGEYLLIEVPINPICRPDCKGLCQVCGEDLNQVVCEHVSQIG